MLINIHPQNPQERLIKQAADVLRKGGVIIYPTDTIYGLGCDIFNAQAIERICRIKGINPQKAQLTFVCRDLSHLSDYAKAIPTPTFRLLKKGLPGPFTFILQASKQVPKLMKSKKDTVGIRVPDNKIVQSLIHELDHPIMSVSLPMDEDVSYYTDPELMEERFGKLVDLVIDGGPGNITPSTVVDCTTPQPQLIREGAGDYEDLLNG